MICERYVQAHTAYLKTWQSRNYCGCQGCRVEQVMGQVNVQFTNPTALTTPNFSIYFPSSIFMFLLGMSSMQREWYNKAVLGSPLILGIWTRSQKRTKEFFWIFKRSNFSHGFIQDWHWHFVTVCEPR